MNQLAVLPKNSVFAKDQELFTDSLTVAKIFHKRHADVLRKIDEMMTQVPDSFIQRHFALNETAVKVGFGVKMRKVWHLTKNGFMLLVMGFTGKEAMALKMAYLEEFDRMRAQLNQANSTVLRQLLAALKQERQSCQSASMAAKILRQRRDEKIANAARIEVYTQQLQPVLNFKG